MTNIINNEPDFIGIGVAKAGTTWIFNCLKEHDEICVSSKKEIHFFDRLSNYKKGVNYYYLFFSHCPQNKIKGEFTPSYIYSQQAPFLIHKNFPNVKIITCLRNPIERAYSHYKYNIEMKGRLSIYKNFKETINHDDEIIERGFYYKQLKNYFTLFQKKQILILFFEDLEKNPREFIKKIYKFLDVNNLDFRPSSINNKILETGKKNVKLKFPFISLILFKFRSWLNMSKQLINSLENSKLMDYVLKITDFNRKVISERNSKGSFIPLDKETRSYLYQIYKDDIQQLEMLLNKDLSYWK